MISNTLIAENIWCDIQQIKQKAPLVHNITNYVAMNISANALLALGASPVMAHAREEMSEMTGIAQCLVINIGTLDSAWVETMTQAALIAKKKQIPIVLDPVGAGATSYRTNTARFFLESGFVTILRGNGSEIQALTTERGKTKGVDSVISSETAKESAVSLSNKYSIVTVISGQIDVVIHQNKIVRISNGHEIMTKVTALGCVATAITGAFCAINPDPQKAAVHAMAVMGITGELAKEKSSGPGSFLPAFLDALYYLNQDDLQRCLRIEGYEKTI